MRDTLENRFTMFGAVETLLDANTAKTAVLTAFAPAFTSFKTLKSQIETKETERKGTTSGKTTDKKQARTALVDELTTICGLLRAFASATSNNAVFEIADKKKSFFDKLRDTDLVPEAKLILTTANENAVEIVAYGITAADITSLESRINEYQPTLGKRELSVSTRSAVGAEVTNIFNAIDTILESQLDNMMEKFRKSDTQFYNEYWNARKIVDLGGGGDNEEEDPTPAENPNP